MHGAIIIKKKKQISFALASLLKGLILGSSFR